MKIERLDVYYVEMPLIYPWRTAYGEDYDIHSVLVRATGDGHTAWSESTPFFAPTYLPESAGSVFYHVTEVFGPYVVGRRLQPSRVPGSGVRGRGSGERETTASSLAGKEESSRKEDNSGQGKDGPAGAIAQGGNGR